MKRVMALALLLAAPAMAQDAVETVEVRDLSLSGLWRIRVPASFGTNGVTTKFEPMRDIFCRIAGGEIHCLNGGYTRSGAVALEDRAVHIAWGTAMARMVIDGTYGNGAINGRFAFKLAGLRHEAAEPSRSSRLPPLTLDGDPGGKAALLRQILTQIATGPLGVPHDNTAIARNEGAFPKDLSALGAIEIIAYLGTSPRMGRPDQPDFFDTYAVEFTGGELICGLHQREDGVVDAFRCV